MPYSQGRIVHGPGIADVELGARKADQIVTGPLSRAQHVQPEHAGRAGEEQPHRIEMSELSPTMKR